MNNNKTPRGYTTFPFLFDYQKRGIPKSKPVKVVPMKRIDKNNND